MKNKSFAMGSVLSKTMSMHEPGDVVPQSQVTLTDSTSAIALPKELILHSLLKVLSASAAMLLACTPISSLAQATYADGKDVSIVLRNTLWDIEINANETDANSATMEGSFRFLQGNRPAECYFTQTKVTGAGYALFVSQKGVNGCSQQCYVTIKRDTYTYEENCTSGSPTKGTLIHVANGQVFSSRIAAQIGAARNSAAIAAAPRRPSEGPGSPTTSAPTTNEREGIPSEILKPKLALISKVKTGYIMLPESMKLKYNSRYGYYYGEFDAVAVTKDTQKPMTTITFKAKVRGSAVECVGVSSVGMDPTYIQCQPPQSEAEMLAEIKEQDRQIASFNESYGSIGREWKLTGRALKSADQSCISQSSTREDITVAGQCVERNMTFFNCERYEDAVREVAVQKYTNSCNRRVVFNVVCQGTVSQHVDMAAMASRQYQDVNYSQCTLQESNHQ